MNRSHRILSLLLAALMFLASVPVAGIMTFADTGASDEDYIIRDDALHFIIRHWHTGFDPDATQQDKAAQKDGEDWFVIVEGYIVRLRDGDEGYGGTDENGRRRNFRILLVNQETGKLVLASAQTSPYIKDFNVQDGTLTLAIKPRREKNPLFGLDGEPEYIELERYSGISLSAGRGAIDYEKDSDDNTTGIIIEYKDGNTHIVKGHVFYNSWNRTVPGSADPCVFPEGNEEYDTAEVYTWAEGNGRGQTAGDIVKYRDPNNAGADIVCKTQGDEEQTQAVLEAAAAYYLGIENNDANKAEIQAFITQNFSADPTMFYSTAEGLHTNKTLVQEGDSGRLFLADLEAWYIEGKAANVAFVLDASGSMAFVSESPSKVNVYYAVANRVGINITARKVGDDDDDVVYVYSYTSKNTGETYSAEALNDAENDYAELGKFIEAREKDPAIRGEFLDAISDKIGSTFTQSHWDTLFGRVGKVKTETNWNNIFILDGTVLSVLLNPKNTAHTQLGVAAYNYFVYDANDPSDFGDTGIATKEFAPLAYWDGVKATSEGTITVAWAAGSKLGKLDQAGKNEAGWYYLTHGSSASEISAAESAKRLFGLDGSKTTDAVSGNKTPYINVKDYADLPGYKRGGTRDGTGKEYNPGTNGWGTATRFYLDEKGNLRCFFSRGSGLAACSYVYELADSQYVKTEALQRVLANFSTKLSERSPSSLISAVKFSMDAFTSKELVLLDWTSNTEEIAGIMSQKRGNGTAAASEPSKEPGSAGINQYNYFLTGGTYAYTGLKAFQELLAEDDRLDDEASKFLILFTDGVLQEGTTNDTKAITYADALKALGYTIITVYLPCGPAVDANGELDTTNEEYLTARNKLVELASERDDGEAYFFASTDLSTLTKIFEEEILAQIADVMDDYTVQDYIDPRFDLMEETGEGNVVWHLNAAGQVVKTTEDGKVIETIEDVNVKNSETEDYYTFHLTREATPTARDPYLRYDATNDMYYLEWVEQVIPSTPIGSDSLLPVWNAEFLLRAKEDFIGGNAILSNGNAEKMNWVFHPADTGVQADRDAYQVKLQARFEQEFEDLTTKQKFNYAKEYATDLRLNLTGKTRWSELSADEHNRVKGAYVDERVDEKLAKKTSGDASSGTEDMRKEYQKKTVNGQEVNDLGHPIDQYPSKGFPRTTANVRLLPIVTRPIDGVMYLGEAVSPRQMLMEIEDKYITESYYLDYLKRYAYQIYGGKNETPLLELLTLWLEVENNDVVKKEFSLPYIYLPSYEYNAETGKFTLDGQSNNIKLNNTGGVDTHEKDVVGILTYRWERITPEPGEEEYDSAIKDYVKDNTDRVVFSLTVEFTPLRVGDTLDGIEEETKSGIFSKYVPLEKDVSGQVIPRKEAFKSDDLFDRLQYVNGVTTQTRSGIQTLALVKDGYKLVTESAYKWDPVYKPTAAAPQLTNDKQPGEQGYPYGNAVFVYNDRTLTAHSMYTKDVVSGGIALELRMLIGELKEALDHGVFDESFELTATRKFVDNEYIEKIKAQAQTTRAVGVWDDYGDAFTFTFKFDIQEGDLEALAKTASKDGYVSIFTKTENIAATFGGEEIDIIELPIGTYAFDSNEINEKLNDLIQEYLHFATVGYEKNGDNFDRKYFDDRVLNGLHTTNEGETGSTWADGKSTAEITNDNIKDFIAEAGMGTDKVYFYVGTEPNSNPNDPTYNYVPKRGSSAEGSGYYISDRLGMLKLSTGTVRLTVRERGAESDTEHFIYHITGYTLGAGYVLNGEQQPITVDFYISVPGNGETAIELLPGYYTVEECDTWAWKYENKETWGGKEKGDEESETWTISSDWLRSDTSLHHLSEDPLEEHKTVTYEHVRNSKTWLGKEGSADNLYDPVSSTGSGDMEDEEPTEPTEP